jgi:hypothetical protein
MGMRLNFCSVLVSPACAGIDNGVLGLTTYFGGHIRQSGDDFSFKSVRCFIVGMDF